jgi:hypothetical protein
LPNDVAILGELKENGRRDYGKLWRELIVAIQGEDHATEDQSQADVSCAL